MGEISGFLELWEMDVPSVRRRLILAPTPRERELWYALWLLTQGWAARDTAHALERDPHTAHRRPVARRLRRRRAGGPDFRAVWGLPPALGEGQQAALKAAVLGLPGEMDIELANWNWRAVRHFVLERFGIGLSRSSCLNYLHRLGFVLKRPKARLLMLLQWRAGFRISEAIAITPADLALESGQPAMRVRLGKGAKDRVVPVHPELREVLYNVVHYRASDGPIIGVSRQAGYQWVQRALVTAEKACAIARGKRIGTHTLRHSFARHVLTNGVPLNQLQVWLGHESLSTTEIYLRLAPDTGG